MMKRTVDLSSPGMCRYMPSGRSLEDEGCRVLFHEHLHDVSVEQKDGALFVNKAEVVLWESPEQEAGQSIQFDVLKSMYLDTTSSDLKALPDSLLEFLRENPEFIPEAWKRSSRIFFWGTEYRTPPGFRVIRYLAWSQDEEKWCCGYEHPFHDYPLSNEDTLAIIYRSSRNLERP